MQSIRTPVHDKPGHMHSSALRVPSQSGPSNNVQQRTSEGGPVSSSTDEPESGTSTGPQKKGKKLRWQQQQLLLLQQQVEERLKQFSEVEAENQRLQQKLRVLEAVLPVREHQIGMLKAKQANSELQRISSTSVSARPDDSSSPGTSVSGNLDSMLLDSTAEWPLPALTRGTSQIPSHAEAGPSKELLNQVAAVWVEFARNCALHTMAFEAHPHRTVHLTRLNEHIATFIAGVSALVLDEPQAWFMMLHRNLESGADDPPPESHWTAVAKAIDPKAEQLQDCRAALALFHEKMSDIVAERKQLSKELSHTIAKPQLQVTTQPELTAEIEALTNLLKDNVLKERSARGIIMDFVGARVFTPFQTAKLVASSYPYIIDSVALISAVVQRADAQEAGLPHSEPPK